MKTRYKIILISFIAVILFYTTIVTYATNPFDVFNLNSIFYFPGIVKQLVANEGNGIICTDACGPCSAWGYEYILIDGQCVLPSVESCKLLDAPGEWAFDEWTCKPVCKNAYQENCATVGDRK
ncbi:hypothetical protein [Nitrosopumilus adriaticus]|uniref:Uncharacterized protein n=1 Tax=Nitrosopumilus adriaticus TaxID=1580092 RepID=A0A0D5C1B7_9ARCH|nr:hypothetical protein [Nitrosopumilus adriaticus]AJW70338.1 exported protein of unknown function [Nitrosopumilus adriaticus]